MTMPRDHPYRSLPIPRDAPFELGPSPGKGWGVFATRRIRQGVTILQEKPLFVIPKLPREITEADVQADFLQLGRNEKAIFLCLRNNASKPFTSMNDAMAENSFAVHNSLQPNLPSRQGLFILHSRFNHSCLPNSKIPVTSGETITSFAVRDIEAGQEITFCYNTDFELRTRDDRHKQLRFVCDCRACLPGTRFQQLSDMRRRFVRGLQYLTLGIDLDGQKQNSTSPIIFNAKLKRDAEEFCIPISNRFICDILSVFLLEEEGLLDQFLLSRMAPGIQQMANIFKTKENSSIALLATQQKTWLAKFCVAFKLYGRSDAADSSFAEQLRMVKRLTENERSW